MVYESTLVDATFRAMAKNPHKNAVVIASKTPFVVLGVIRFLNQERANPKIRIGPELFYC